MTIRGLSGAYTRGVRTATLTELAARYKPDAYPAMLDYRTSFSRRSLSGDSVREKPAAVKTDAIAAVWLRLASRRNADPPEAVLATLYRRSADTYQQSRSSRGDNHVATGRLQTQLRTIEQIQDEWQDLSADGRFCTILILAGYYNRKADDLRRSALALAIDRMGGNAVEDERLAFLEDDIEPEALTLRQTGYLVAFLSDIAEHIAADASLQKWLDESGELGNLLAPLALTRRKETSPETLDAAFRAITNLSTLSKELAGWQEVEGRQEVANRQESAAGPGQTGENAEEYLLFTSRTPLDAYFGDMGATCLSNSPDHIRDRGFLNIRMIDRKRQEIVGMAALQFVNATVPSTGDHGFWFAFAFNPIRAVLHGLGTSQLLNLYIRFREVVTTIAERTGKPVYIPGITAYGVVSNDTAFGNLIIATEKERGGRFVHDARGFALQYGEDVYAHAIRLNV